MTTSERIERAEEHTRLALQYIMNAIDSDDFDQYNADYRKKLGEIMLALLKVKEALK